MILVQILVYIFLSGLNLILSTSNNIGPLLNECDNTMAKLSNPRLIGASFKEECLEELFKDIEDDDLLYMLKNFGRMDIQYKRIDAVTVSVKTTFLKYINKINYFLKMVTNENTEYIQLKTNQYLKITSLSTNDTNFYNSWFGPQRTRYLPNTRTNRSRNYCFKNNAYIENIHCEINETKYQYFIKGLESKEIKLLQDGPIIPNITLLHIKKYEKQINISIILDSALKYYVISSRYDGTNEGDTVKNGIYTKVIELNDITECVTKPKTFPFFNIQIEYLITPFYKGKAANFVIFLLPKKVFDNNVKDILKLFDYTSKQHFWSLLQQLADNSYVIGICNDYYKTRYGNCRAITNEQHLIHFIFNIFHHD